MRKLKAKSKSPLSIHNSISNDSPFLFESPYLDYKKRKQESVVHLKRIYSRNSESRLNKNTSRHALSFDK